MTGEPVQPETRPAPARAAERRHEEEARELPPTELMRRGYEAWERGDLEWILAHTSPDFELHTAQLVQGVKPVYSGREGQLEYWRTWRALWKILSIEVERVEDLGGGRALALITFRGIWRDGGVEIIYQFSHLADFEGGQCTRLQGFAGWDDALAAAGLV